VSAGSFHGASLNQATTALSHSSARNAVESVALVNQTAKSARLRRAGEVRGSANVIAIKLTGPSDVVIRDKRGFVLLAVIIRPRTTNVGK
jgi:hypothetical protein